MAAYSGPPFLVWELPPGTNAKDASGKMQPFQNDSPLALRADRVRPSLVTEPACTGSRE